jgi:hypothetical protein
LLYGIYQLQPFIFTLKVFLQLLYLPLQCFIFLL